MTDLTVKVDEERLGSQSLIEDLQVRRRLVCVCVCVCGCGCVCVQISFLAKLKIVIYSCICQSFYLFFFNSVFTFFAQVLNLLFFQTIYLPKQNNYQNRFCPNIVQNRYLPKQQNVHSRFLPKQPNVQNRFSSKPPAKMQADSAKQQNNKKKTKVQNKYCIPAFEHQIPLFIYLLLGGFFGEKEPLQGKKGIMGKGVKIGKKE